MKYEVTYEVLSEITQTVIIEGDGCKVAADLLHVSKGNLTVFTVHLRNFVCLRTISETSEVAETEQKVIEEPELNEAEVKEILDAGTQGQDGPEDEEDTPQELTTGEHKELVREALSALQRATDSATAKKVLADHGAKTMGKLSVEEYDNVIAACEELIS